MKVTTFLAKTRRNKSLHAMHLLTISMIGLTTNCSPAWADSSQFDLSSLQPAVNLGASALSPRANGRMPLPVVSTGSVDINSVDMPFLRSNGGNGAFPQASSSGGTSSNGGSNGSSGSQIPPDLPPGYAAVMCHGTYAGAIPPGGNIEDFWRGAYGFSGDAAQQAALMQEGEWLRQNGQI